MSGSCNNRQRRNKKAVDHMLMREVSGAQSSNNPLFVPRSTEQTSRMYAEPGSA